MFSNFRSLVAYFKYKIKVKILKSVVYTSKFFKFNKLKKFETCINSHIYKFDIFKNIYSYKNFISPQSN